MAFTFEKDTWTWPRKTVEEPVLGPRLANWRPIQLTPQLRLRPQAKTAAAILEGNHPDGERDENEPNCTKQFHLYCDYTTMHGIRYIAEEKRTVCEK